VRVIAAYFVSANASHDAVAHDAVPQQISTMVMAAPLTQGAVIGEVVNGEADRAKQRAVEQRLSRGGRSCHDEHRQPERDNGVDERGDRPDRIERSVGHSRNRRQAAAIELFRNEAEPDPVEDDERNDRRSERLQHHRLLLKR
jgi:hypothetical protein